MTKRRWVVLIVAVVVVLLAAGGGFAWWQNRNAKPQTEPAPATPVAIKIAKAPKNVTIGVIVTLSSKPGEGEDWKYAAEGAQVAAQRLSMGGVQVDLKTVDDKGTADGAEKAVKQLAADNVSGIVAASEGSHLSGAVDAAKEAGVPLLMPYESDPDLQTDWSWETGPTDAEVAKALTGSMAKQHLSQPLVIDAGGGVPKGVKPHQEISFEVGDDADGLLKRVQAITDPRDKKGKPVPVKDPVDSVVVSGPATQLAAVERQLQGGQLGLPILFTPDATSPAFTDALIKADGSLSGDLNSVGADDGDPVALRSDDAGRAMGSYLTAVRLMAEDADRKSLMGDQDFATVTGAADSASHDAVVALVQAAAVVAQGQATDVRTALQHLKLDHGKGLAGPALDFSRAAALDPKAVVALRSSDQDLGLRPQTEDAKPRLIWFASSTPQ